MKTVVGAFVGVLLSAAVASAQAPDPKLVEAGKKLYEQHGCVKCHSIEGKGNKQYPLDGVGLKLTKEQIHQWMVAPAEMEAKLPAPPKLKMSTAMRTKKFSDADIAAFVAYMQSLNKKQ